MVALFLSFLFLSAFNFIKPVLKLKISKNGRFLIKENGDPFFWFGDQHGTFLLN